MRKPTRKGYTAHNLVNVYCEINGQMKHTKSWIWTKNNPTKKYRELMEAEYKRLFHPIGTEIYVEDSKINLKVR